MPNIRRECPIKRQNRYVQFFSRIVVLDGYTHNFFLTKNLNQYRWRHFEFELLVQTMLCVCMSMCECLEFFSLLFCSAFCFFSSFFPTLGLLVLFVRTLFDSLCLFHSHTLSLPVIVWNLFSLIHIYTESRWLYALCIVYDSAWFGVERVCVQCFNIRLHRFVCTPIHTYTCWIKLMTKNYTSVNPVISIHWQHLRSYVNNST